MGILFAAVFSGIGIIWDRQFGFLKETLVAMVEASFSESIGVRRGWGNIPQQK
jgi:hypothetical protein